MFSLVVLDTLIHVKDISMESDLHTRHKIHLHRFRRNLIRFVTPLLRNLVCIFTVSLSLVQLLLNFLCLAQPVCHGANHLKSLLFRVVVFRFLFIYTLSKKGLYMYFQCMYIY